MLVVSYNLANIYRYLTVNVFIETCIWILFFYNPGKESASDAQIYINSESKECVEDGSIWFPDIEPLPNDTQDVPYFLIADDAFALKPNLEVLGSHYHHRQP